MKWILGTCLLFASCTIKDAPRPDSNQKKRAATTMDQKTPEKAPVVEVEQESISEADLIDSIRAIEIDTSNLEGKRHFLLREFNLSIYPMGALYDTLIDMNYDSKLDYVIGTHPMSGSGESMEVFLYDQADKCYIKDIVLSYLMNPSLYLDEKRISSFYMGYGSGKGEEYEWSGHEWVKMVAMSMVNHGNSTVWKITDLASGDEKEVALPYQNVPPQEVLKNKFDGYE